ncbi:amidohydrolase family protein [Algoriphagus mannitolivorans]|uniref:amidohydrolase family protein n=1 Tax=Algoriphagus mannitolivorans TaxID=226504 RepID=UPI0003FBA204|nr:amidohydrolase family protein [Algoriphagus mannitolivorans]
MGKLTQGATLFDGTGNSISNSVIILQDGKISAVGGSEVEIPENANLIDVSGKFITPGLVDAHVHFSQTGFFDGRPDALDLRDTLRFDSLQARLKRNPYPYLESYLRSGVTAVYDVGGYEWTIDLATSAEADLNAPHVAAAGPLLTPFDQERLDIFNVPPARQMLALTSPEFGREYVQKSTDSGSTGIKIWSLNLKDSIFLQSLRAVAEEVNTQGNQLIVHATNLDEAKEAIRLGAKVLVHSVDDQVLDEEFIQMVKESGVIVCPTLVVISGYGVAFRSLQGTFPMNDPNQVVDPYTKALLNSSQSFFKFYPDPKNYQKNLLSVEKTDRKISDMMLTNLKILYDSGITIALSTDAGNPGTLHGLSIYDELEAMQKAGISANDLIPMATQNGAKAMRRSDDFGTLEVGKMADLIILEKDPSLDASNFRSITHVMRGGLLRPVNVPFEK